MNKPIHVHSVEDFIARVRTDSEGWPHVWFRAIWCRLHMDRALCPRDVN